MRAPRIASRAGSERDPSLTGRSRGVPSHDGCWPIQATARSVQPTLGQRICMTWDGDSFALHDPRETFRPPVALAGRGSFYKKSIPRISDRSWNYWLARRTRRCGTRRVSSSATCIAASTAPRSPCMRNGGPSKTTRPCAAIQARRRSEQALTISRFELGRYEVVWSWAP